MRCCTFIYVYICVAAYTGAENNHLENTVESLRMDKKKYEFLQQQVQVFKAEYKSRIGTYKKRMKRLQAVVEAAAAENGGSIKSSLGVMEGDGRGEEDGAGEGGGGASIQSISPADARKMNELERAMNGLLAKVEEVGSTCLLLEEVYVFYWCVELVCLCLL